ncbi:NAD-dependent epimerase [Gammaproteobacteria bacterium]|nr:NAD-dependent epimerase [Gammaproteobacteria bacterium]
MKILVTGAAGFIGYHLSRSLIQDGHEVIGLDVINDYYDIKLKKDRLKQLGIDNDNLTYNQIVNSSLSNLFKFVKIDLCDDVSLNKLFDISNFDAVCNLAAQAGVRYSLEYPLEYINSNIVGFFNILESCRNYDVQNLSYASSSSVYGLNEASPFTTDSSTDHPMSLYAASKKSNEVMAHAYSNLYDISTTGLRFFTVYGPWGRPDMALFLFVKAALEDEAIDVYNYGDMYRDFTYIDDIVEGIKLVINNPAKSNDNWSGANPLSSSSKVPYKIYNIGNNNPVKLLDFIDFIEKKLGKTIKKQFIEIQPGDVPSTFADVSDLKSELEYQPSHSVEDGISKFIDWYLKYYKS